MKELSTEQKAERYNEASKWMENVYPTLSHEQQMEAEAFFPMFKESEDERIRKGLINFFSEPGRKEYILNGGFTVNDIIAWLEKQDPHYSFEIKKGYWYKCVCDYMLNGSDLIFKNDRLYYCRSDWRLRGEIDERNVKDIGVNGYKSFFRPATNQEIKDWLEKQGSKPNWCHHEVDLSNCSEEYRKAYYDGWYNCSIQHSQRKSDRNDVVKCLINGMKFYYEDNEEATWGTEKFSMKVKDILSWLEEQGEKKPIVVPKFREGDRIIEKSFDECGCGTIKEIKDGKYIFDDGSFVNIEEQNLWQLVEQKPVDKVEPKFHEDEWVVSPNGVYWHIDKISNNRYEVTSNTGVSSDWNLDTNIYHRFTVQEIKDGDVLSYRDGQWIFIYKEKIDNNSFYYHALYSTIHQDLTINDSGFTLLGDAIVPATNEERDILMKAMADAGYTFDFEKKELRKIEHPKLTEFEDAVKDMMDDYRDAIGDNDATTEEVKERAAYMLSLIPHKPAEWSEEDIMRIDNIIAIIEGKGYPDYVRWLESLKDKVSPQPKQEWSKEDEDMLLSAIEYVCTFSAYRNSVVDWLKSLKNRVQSQPNPKWGEEDDYNLQCMIAKVTSDIQKGNVGRNNELIDWLKSLRYKTGSQKYWKPGESEIKILEDLFNGKINPSNYQATLQNFLEQLKILRDYE